MGITRAATDAGRACHDLTRPCCHLSGQQPSHLASALLIEFPGNWVPVLCAMVGSVGLNAAVFALALSFVSAGVAALWKIVVGWAGTQSRVPMGPWMIASALVGTIAWGVVPDWL